MLNDPQFPQAKSFNHDQSAGLVYAELVQKLLVSPTGAGTNTFDIDIELFRLNSVNS